MEVFILIICGWKPLLGIGDVTRDSGGPRAGVDELPLLRERFSRVFIGPEEFRSEG